MNWRQHRKIGWYGGFLGGTCFLVPLGLIALWRGAWGLGLVALALFSANVVMVLSLAPWKHPGTRYGMLILPFWVLNILGLGVILHLEGGPNSLREIVRMVVFLGGLALVTMVAQGSVRWEEEAVAQDQATPSA